LRLTKARVVLAVVIAAAPAALCHHLGADDQPPTEFPWAFDVTSGPSLERSCARRIDASAPKKQSFIEIDDELGRWYTGQYNMGQSPDMSINYRLSLSFDFGAYDEPPQAPSEFMANWWRCEFHEKQSIGTLSVKMAGVYSPREAEAFLREVGMRARSKPEQIDAVVKEFEEGRGVYAWPQEPSESLRLDRPGLSIFIAFSEPQRPRGDAGRWRPPGMLRQSETRYQAEVTFVPERG
jgi:hypothetical protein